jgi:hypothetical protein
MGSTSSQKERAGELTSSMATVVDKLWKAEAAIAKPSLSGQLLHFCDSIEPV